jgi:hypothetical protein
MFFELLFLKNYVMLKGPLASIVFFTKLFYGIHSFLYYQHQWHVKGVIIIESPLNTR